MNQSYSQSRRQFAKTCLGAIVSTGLSRGQAVLRSDGNEGGFKIGMQPFKVKIEQFVLNDLRERLARTRWPDSVTGAKWDYGVNLDYMKALVAYWQRVFNWRAQEELINRFQQFRTDVDGSEIHFIYERGNRRSSIPLVITHGWPSSFFQMWKIIPLLTDPEQYGGKPSDSFDVVVPSMPGYGFSAQPTGAGWTTSRIADIWATLMTRKLGYRRFGAQGGDIGAGVTTRLGLHHSNKLIGIHLTNVANPYLGPGTRELTEAEKALMKEEEAWDNEEGAYASIQATRPQTLAYALNDSPVGLAAWIIEKFRAWSDCDGDVEKRFTKEELLTNVMIYWTTETINSSIRLYYEGRHHGTALRINDKVVVPTAVALFPKDLSQPPREWAERTYNVQRWTKMPRGGHFAAMEEPELLAEDIRAFFRPLR